MKLESRQARIEELSEKLAAQSETLAEVRHQFFGEAPLPFNISKEVRTSGDYKVTMREMRRSLDKPVGETSRVESPRSRSRSPSLGGSRSPGRGRSPGNVY